MSISNRERYKAIAQFQKPGDLYSFEILWDETLANWVKQGAPKEILARGTEMYGNSFFRNYFQLEKRYILTQVASAFGGQKDQDLGHDIIDIMGGGPLIPAFKPRIITEDERTTTYVNEAGQTIKVFKKSSKMPMFLDWPVKDWATWKELKKRLDPFTPERWPADWDAFVKEANSQDEPVVLLVGGFFCYPREWIGSENILYMFYDDPALIEDMMDQMLYLETEVVKRVCKDVKVDEADYCEDIAYKVGPLISPDMVKKFMVPRYKKLNELLRSNGVDLIYLDSDGKVEELIPLWVEAGINYVWPLEQAAGNDVITLRKKYGKNLTLSGAIDKRALIKGKEAIKEEVMSKVPYLFEQGGYFPTVDHAVPPEVTFENYCYYINLLREVAGLEKLSFK
jgi:hypothetical protein